MTGGDRGSHPLLPWASPADGSPGWKILVPSPQLAASIASGEDGDARAAEAGTWQVIIRRANLDVTVLDADPDTLYCALPAEPDAVLGVTRRRRGAAETSCPPVLPAQGVLTVRQVFTETRMGTLCMSPVPVFTASERGREGDDEPMGLECPACGERAAFSIPGQAFCGNDDCDLLLWETTMTRREWRELPPHYIDLTGGTGPS